MIKGKTETQKHTEVKFCGYVRSRENVYISANFNGRIEAYTLNDTNVSESVLIPFRKKQFL